MQGLNEISGELSGIVEKAAPSVVRVEARHRVPGSGIVWASDGTIVTADHIIEREEDLRIGLADGRVVEATLVGRDPTTDVAVLRAQAAGLSVPAWTDGERTKVGQLVLALARPGRTVRARLGMISALGDAWRAPAGGELTRYLEADVAIRFGFSGGPLVDTAIIHCLSFAVRIFTCVLRNWLSLTSDLRPLSSLLEVGRWTLSVGRFPRQPRTS